jgi:enoyl-[acyl-carrier protein] reductase/trans-2-enoyl-CoA reductase (NAD+)
MMIEPKVRNNTCLTSHPIGCAENVQEEIAYVKSRSHHFKYKNVLVIGSSTGYGLSSRIVAAFGAGAKTVGVAFEKPEKENSTGTPGWYNTITFEEMALKEHIPAYSINGDAFTAEVKQQTIELIKKHLGKVDLVVYSLAAPRRTDPVTGELYSSVIKPIGNQVTTKSLDLVKGLVNSITVEPATAEQIRQTVKVMGGEDWELWIKALYQAGTLAEGVRTVAFSYIGPKLTNPFYRHGTLGKAKEHLEATALTLTDYLKELKGEAIVSVNKALVTRASAVIPAVPLYMAILYKIMKEKGIHEGCIEQAARLFNDYLAYQEPETDVHGRIRIDDWELREDVQDKVLDIWNKVNTGNLTELTDICGVQEDFYKFFGFRTTNVNN